MNRLPGFPEAPAVEHHFGASLSRTRFKIELLSGTPMRRSRLSRPAEPRRCSTSSSFPTNPFPGQPAHDAHEEAPTLDDIDRVGIALAQAASNTNVSATHQTGVTPRCRHAPMLGDQCGRSSKSAKFS